MFGTKEGKETLGRRNAMPFHTRQGFHRDVYRSRWKGQYAFRIYGCGMLERGELRSYHKNISLKLSTIEEKRTIDITVLEPER